MPETDAKPCCTDKERLNDLGSEEYGLDLGSEEYGPENDLGSEEHGPEEVSIVERGIFIMLAHIQIYQISDLADIRKWTCNLPDIVSVWELS